MTALSSHRADEAPGADAPRRFWLWFPPVLLVVELAWRMLEEASYRRF